VLAVALTATTFVTALFCDAADSFIQSIGKAQILQMSLNHKAKRNSKEQSPSLVLLKRTYQGPTKRRTNLSNCLRSGERGDNPKKSESMSFLSNSRAYHVLSLFKTSSRVCLSEISLTAAEMHN